MKAERTPEQASILMRLKKDKVLALSNVWDVLFEHEAIMCDVVEIVQGRIESGDHVLLANLVKLLAHTKSKSLYELVKKDIFSDVWALTDLFRSEFPDPEIELKLLEKLYEYAGDDGQPRRSYIAEALRDVGTIESIPVLEAILYDQVDTVAAKRVISDAVDAVSPQSMEAILANVVFQSRREFVQLIVDAINAIKQRGVSSVLSTDLSGPIAAVDFGRQPDVKNAILELNQAKKRLEENDPVLAVVCLRKGAEALGKHLYRTVGLEDRGKPAKKLMLNDLMKPVKDSNVPDVFKLCFEALQLFGNFSSHDQDEEHHHLNPRIAEAILILYEEALDMYGRWIESGEPSAKG